MTNTLRSASGLAAAALLASCSLSTGTDGSIGAIGVIGRVERGLNIAIEIRRNGVVERQGPATVSFSPINGATLDTNSTFKLVKDGPLLITINTGGNFQQISLVVATPPQILFDMVVAGNRDIYSAALDGAGLQQLSSSSAVDTHATAAAGTVIFTSFRDGNAELYTRQLTGAPNESRLSATTGVNETDPRISPDGQRIAYTRDDGGTPRVWVASVQNMNDAQLSPVTGTTIQGTPAWRFSSDSLLIMSTSLGNASIFAVGAVPGSTPANVAKPGTSDSVYVEPAWSANGALIAYAAATSGGLSRIAVRSRATGIANYVTPATMSAGQPVFLPDGRIVFTVFAAGGPASLAWVDPAVPLVVYPITLVGNDAQHPAIIWP